MKGEMESDERGGLVVDGPALAQTILAVFEGVSIGAGAILPLVLVLGSSAWSTVVRSV